jgi:hypothetical protein
MNRASEIAQLEHELENLYASSAAMQRGTFYFRTFVRIVLVGAVLVAVYSLVIMSMPGIALGAIIASMAGAILIAFKMNWIGVLGWGIEGQRTGYVEATAIMIREREKRLAELKGRQP